MKRYRRSAVHLASLLDQHDRLKRAGLSDDEVRLVMGFRGLEPHIGQALVLRVLSETVRDQVRRREQER
jgi:hypothetical protein